MTLPRLAAGPTGWLSELAGIEAERAWLAATPL
jgi:hypothetical protein